MVSGGPVQNMFFYNSVEMLRQTLYSMENSGGGNCGHGDKDADLL